MGLRYAKVDFGNLGLLQIRHVAGIYVRVKSFQMLRLFEDEYVTRKVQLLHGP